MSSIGLAACIRTRTGPAPRGRPWRARCARAPPSRRRSPHRATRRHLPTSQAGRRSRAQCRGAAIGDQVRDRADLRPVKLREGYQIGQARHRSVVVHHLADHARRISGRPAARCPPRPLYGPRGPARRRRGRAAGRCDPAWRCRCDRDSGSIATATVQGAVMGRDAGHHPLARLDGRGERGLVARRVRRGHQRQAQRVEPLAGQRPDSQAAGRAWP